MTGLRQKILKFARRLNLEPQLRRLQRALSRGSHRRGYVDDEHTRLLISLALPAGSSCIDIGANMGTVLDDIVAAFPDGPHIAFEPLPHLARRLEERFPGVDVRNIALSDHSGMATFTHYVDAPGHSTLGEESAGEAGVEHLQVPLQPLDEALPAGFVPAFIKIDVEGAEEQVFRGMLGTLRAHKPLVVFEHGDHAERFGTTSGDIHDLLVGEAGLRLFDVDGNGPFTREEFAAYVAGGEMWTWVARS
ncbi:MAG: FkbM family methyltransferase [Solirubrobacteraceae bacterium]|nr:FkbM family methyltransferase [Solirubrobacteraceae bacterium]